MPSWPFETCWHCGGSGKYEVQIDADLWKAIGDCEWCDGRGEVEIESEPDEDGERLEEVQK